MNEIILLGAGASVEAGIPDAYKMTEVVIDCLYDYRFTKNIKHAQIALFIVGGLLFQKGVIGQNPLRAGVNIEDFINAIHLLSERNTSEISPFVGSWHSLVEEFDRIDQNYQGRNRFIDELINSLARSRRPSPPELKREFEKALSQTKSMPGGGSIFKELKTVIIEILKTITWIKSPEPIAYLNPIINKAINESRLVVATLNYDNSIEYLAQKKGLICNLGIDNWAKTGLIDIQKDCLHLLKLHGSMDWYIGFSSEPEYLSPPIKRSKQPLSDSFPPAIIFGQRNKLTAEGPFLDLLIAFREELRKVNKLIIIGYSFRDEHINTYIINWLANNNDNCLKIIDPGFNNNDTIFVKNIKDHLESNRLQVIDRPASEGLIDL
jgi:hypothetical protein